MKKVIAAVTALALLCGCSQEADWTIEHVSRSDQAAWTVLLYLCGSDLETDYSCASYNLEELMNASFGNEINIIVETGGADYWHTDGVSSAQQARYCIHDGIMSRVWADSPQNMGDSKTLGNFISWSAENFPAEKYALILWDHGGGSLYGLCSDQLFNDDTLSLSELSDALDDGGENFELIGFDACLMASLETAEAVMNHGKYMAASEETEPGYGWDYKALAEFLDAEPEARGAELGRNIVDSYYEKCASFELDDTATLSLLRLSEIPALSEAFSLYTTGLLSSSADAQALRDIQQGADSTETYGVVRDDSSGFNMVDLGGLMDHTSGVIQAAEDVKNALQEAVIYENHGQARSGSSGISVFYPLNADEDVLNAYSDISDNAAYIEYTSILSGNAYDRTSWQNASSEWSQELENDSGSSGLLDLILQSLEQLSSLEPVSENNAGITWNQYLDDDNILHLDIVQGREYVRNVWFDIYYEDEENGRYFYLGSDNNLYGDYDTGEFQDNFYGDWICIDGEYVNAEIIDEGEDYSLYTIPIQLNGKDTNLRAMYDREKDEYRILGTYDGSSSDDGMSARDNLKKLKNGDKMDFVFTAYPDIDSDDGEEYILDSTVWSDSSVMTDESLGEGRFVYRFTIHDIFGKEIKCDPYVMEAYGEDIYVEPF